MQDLRNVETFVWVARLGGFRLAAEKLNTTQPAVSARVAVLERQLGVSLFERKRRGTLTPKGLEMLGYAERMLQLRSDMVRRVGAEGVAHGVLRIGALETIAHTWLTTLLKRVHAKYPGTCLQIDVTTTPKLRKSLLRQELDIAFHLGPLDEAGITNAPLHSYPVACVASPKLDLPDGRLSLAEVARWPIISSRFHVPHCVAIRQLLANLHLEDAQQYTSTSIASIVRMARDGIGVGVLPPVLIKRELAEGVLRLLDTDFALPGLDFTVSHPKKPESDLAPVVAEVAMEVARDYDAVTS